MNALKNIVPLIFLVVLISTPVFSSEDFQVYTPNQDITVCQCSSSTQTLTIQNTIPRSETTTSFEITNGRSKQVVSINELPSVYTVTVAGDATAFITTTPGQFALDPRGQGEITHLVQAACGSEGTYNLETTITTETGIEKTIAQDVNVVQCQNIAVEAEETLAATSCPCAPAEYEFTIKNVAPFTETYDFSIESGIFVEYGFSESSVTLAPLESRVVRAVVQSDCSTFGDFAHELVITARFNELEGRVPLSHTVDACYDYTLVSGDIVSLEEAGDFAEHSSDYAICEGETGTLPVQIENDADIENTYTVDFEIPSFASVDFERSLLDRILGRTRFTTTLEAGESVTVGIALNPERGTMGEYTIPITSTTEKGDVAEELDISLSIENCFIPAITLPEAVVNESQSAVLVNVENTGHTETTYTITLDGPTFLSAPGTITLGGANTSATGTIELTSEPTEEKRGNYDYTLTLTADNGVSYTAEGSIKLTRKGFGALFYLGAFMLVLLVVLVVLFFVARKKPQEKDEKRSEMLGKLSKAMDEKPRKEKKLKPVKKAKTEKKAAKHLAKDESLVVSSSSGVSGKIWVTILIAVLALLIIGGILAWRFNWLGPIWTFMKTYWGYLSGALLLLIVLLVLLWPKKGKPTEAKETVATSKSLASQKTAELSPREQRKLEKERLRQEKFEAREKAREEKIAAKMALLAEKDKAKAEKLAAAEKARAERLALIEAKRAEKERLKQEKIDAREKARQEKLDAQQAKIDARNKAKADKEAAAKKAQEKKEKEEAKRLARLEKKKAARAAYKQTDSYHNKIQLTMYIVLFTFLILALGFVFWKFGPGGPLEAKAVNLTEAEEIPSIQEQLLAQGYSTDQVLSSIEGGRYLYNPEGRIVDSSTLRTIPQYEYLQLLRMHKEEIIANTDLGEEGFAVLLKTLDEEYQELHAAIAQADCSFTLLEETTTSINLTAIQDPDGDTLSFHAQGSDHIDFEIRGGEALISPQTDFFGVENVTLMVEDGRGGEDKQVFTICVENTEEDSDAYRKQLINMFSSLKDGNKLFWISIGAGVLVLILVLAFFSKPIMDFLTEEELEEKNGKNGNGKNGTSKESSDKKSNGKPKKK